MSEAEVFQRAQSSAPRGSGRGRGRGRGSSDRPGSGANQSKHDQNHNAVEASTATVALFGALRAELDEHHNKMERLIRVSRDVTADSKKVIFTLQRYNIVRDTTAIHDGIHPANARILSDAHQAFAAIRQKIIDAVCDERLQPDLAVDADRYEHYYGSGLEEFIEALSMMHFLEKRTLLPYTYVQELFYIPRSALACRGAENESSGEMSPSPPASKRRATGKALPDHSGPMQEEMDQDRMDADEDMVQAFSVPPERYILGISDVAGELMRVATNAVGSGDVTGSVVTTVLDTLRELYRTLEAFYGRLEGRAGRELKKKQSVTQESIRKIENVLYTVRVRTSEYADADVALLQEIVQRPLVDSSRPPEDDE